MWTRLWNNEPAAIAGALIALLAVLKAFLRWGGIEMPPELDTALQVAMGAWVGLFVRAKSAPIDGPQNVATKMAATGTGTGGGVSPSRFIGAILLAAALAVSASCAKRPADLAPSAVPVWKANEVVVAIGTLQHVAIALNAVQVCDPMPCHPLLSTRNTGIVIDASTDALLTLKAVPAGWQATANAALLRMRERLDAEGQARLAAYLEAARAVIAGL